MQNGGVLPASGRNNTNREFRRDATVWTSIELPDHLAGEQIAKRGDGTGHVTMGSCDPRAACNPPVSEMLLIRRSFFWNRYV